MIKLYIKQACALLKQNKLFSALYIVGTGCAIGMTVVMAVIYYVKIASIYPEVSRDRTYYVSLARYESEKGSNTMNFSYKVLQEWMFPLQNAEVVSASVTYPPSYKIQPADQSGEFPVVTKLTDPAFFRIYEFRFLDGKPFTDADLQSGIFTAVITDDLARRLFGTTEQVIGRSFMMGYKNYRVCGVVRSASYLTARSYAQVYVPYSTMPRYDRPGFHAYAGPFQLTIRVKDDAQAEALRAELQEVQRKHNLAYPDDWQVEFFEQPTSHLTSVFQESEDKSVDYGSALGTLGLLVLILLLVPALNLSGMITSRMETRLAEMGVRKSFGASRGRLLSQVMWENLLLTLLGGALGLLLAWIGILLSRDWIFGLLDKRPPMLPAGVEVAVTGEMIFAPAVFLAALLFCVVMNLLSALIPAWMSLRKPIVQSLFEKR